MRILLPPSEAKRPGGTGTPLGKRTSQGVLASPRSAALAAIAAYTNVEEAAASLMLPVSVIDASLAANAKVLTSRTMPAIERYAGIVYDGLAVDTLSAEARRIADTGVLIFSGLFGVLRGKDPVPAYRVPGKAVLPGLGIASTYWKPFLDQALPELLGSARSGPIIDLRSTDYMAMWTPTPGLRERTVQIRVLSVRPDGSRGVVSYSSKLGKGKLAQALLERAAAGQVVSGAEDIAEAWLKQGGTAVEERPAKFGVAVDLLD